MRSLARLVRWEDALTGGVGRSEWTGRQRSSSNLLPRSTDPSLLPNPPPSPSLHNPPPQLSTTCSRSHSTLETAKGRARSLRRMRPSRTSQSGLGSTPLLQRRYQLRQPNSRSRRNLHQTAQKQALPPYFSLLPPSPLQLSLPPLPPRLQLPTSNLPSSSSSLPTSLPSPHLRHPKTFRLLTLPTAPVAPAQLLASYTPYPLSPLSASLSRERRSSNSQRWNFGRGKRSFAREPRGRWSCWIRRSQLSSW